jgi:hypothetical protein
MQTPAATTKVKKNKHEVANQKSKRQNVHRYGIPKTHKLNREQRRNKVILCG